MNKAKLIIKHILLKYQIYLNYAKNNYIEFTNLDSNIIINFESVLKHSLKIIFEYHVTKKTILFIGFPKFKKYNNLLNKIRHKFIPPNCWINGLLINKTNVLNFIKSKTKSKILLTLLKIKKKPDLIVIMPFENKIVNSKELLMEINKLKIPYINFNEQHIFSTTYAGNYYNYGNISKPSNLLQKLLIYLIFCIFKMPFKNYNNIVPKVTKRRMRKRLAYYYLFKRQKNRRGFRYYYYKYKKTLSRQRYRKYYYNSPKNIYKNKNSKQSYYNKLSKYNLQKKNYNPLYVQKLETKSEPVNFTKKKK